MNLLIRGATLVTVNERDEVIESGDLAIAADKIVGVGTAPEGFVPDRVVDGRDRIVLPGLVNTHTHLSMTLMRNYADDLAFWPWLLERVKPLEDHLTPDDVRLGARLGLAQWGPVKKRRVSVRLFLFGFTSAGRGDTPPQ